VRPERVEVYEGHDAPAEKSSKASELVSRHAG
jgi:hypothetical protein